MKGTGWSDDRSCRSERDGTEAVNSGQSGVYSGPPSVSGVQRCSGRRTHCWRLVLLCGPFSRHPSWCGLCLGDSLCPFSLLGVPKKKKKISALPHDFIWGFLVIKSYYDIHEDLVLKALLFWFHVCVSIFKRKRLKKEKLKACNFPFTAHRPLVAGDGVSSAVLSFYLFLVTDNGWNGPVNYTNFMNTLCEGQLRSFLAEFSCLLSGQTLPLRKQAEDCVFVLICNCCMVENGDFPGCCGHIHVHIPTSRSVYFETYKLILNKLRRNV